MAAQRSEHGGTAGRTGGRAHRRSAADVPRRWQQPAAHRRLRGRGAASAVGTSRACSTTTAHGPCVSVDAGYGWDAFVDWTLSQGFAGLENLALIPGRRRRADPEHRRLWHGDRRVRRDGETWDRRDGRPVRLAGADCGFTYRDSRFKRELDRWIVTALELRLPRRRAPTLDYPGVREELGPREASPRRPRSQPLSAASGVASSRIRP